MNTWLAMGLRIASKIPVERLLFRGGPSRSEKEEAFLRQLEQEYLQKNSTRGTSETATATSGQMPRRPTSGISTPELVHYQKRELCKSLLLLQKHLEQKCKVHGKACDCCEKHPMEIEGLAQETLGMTGDDIYHEIAEWTKRIEPITTEAASASGQYDRLYPKLAGEARQFRKRIMGTDELSALMTPEQQAWVEDQLREVLKEGGDNGSRERGKPGKIETLRPQRPTMPAGGPETPGGTEHTAGERDLSGTVSGSETAGGEDQE